MYELESYIDCNSFFKFILALKNFVNSYDNNNNNDILA